MSTAEFRQDLPPVEGYRPINYKRIPCKTYFTGWTMIGGYLGMTAVASYIFYLNCKKIHHEEVEERSANFALYPLLLAERDREYLKQLRQNRDEEAELMKGVKDWQVGTYYGEPIYYTTHRNKLIEPAYSDYYVHASFKDYAKRAFLPLLS